MSRAWWERSALELRDGCLAGEGTFLEAVTAIIDRMEAVGVQTGALSESFRESAFAAAAACDARKTAGEAPRPLEGIPFTAKANITTAEGITHAGSQFLREHRAMEDATAVARLREAGAILIGKTHCDEFAMGSSNENSSFGVVRNPWQLECVPGRRCSSTSASMFEWKSSARTTIRSQ